MHCKLNRYHKRKPHYFWKYIPSILLHIAKDSNGLQYAIRQWGSQNAGGIDVKVNFNITFKKEVYFIGYELNNPGIGIYKGVSNISISGATCFRRWYDDTYPPETNHIYWAFGV